jgi:uncharacterized membrane protein
MENEAMESRSIILLIEIGFELVAVAALIIGSCVALVRYVIDLVHRHVAGEKAYRALRAAIEQAVVLALEFLVASDIIRSVALEPTFQSVGVLGLIVAIRTFLSWSLEVEITGEWPWRRARSERGVNDGANAL